MKTLRITTYWTAEEADCIYQLLDELKSVVWENYGEEILEMHRAIQVEQQTNNEIEDFNDELPF
jgi:NTP pyrophosphatase (non-canonical NTP hydrolase)